MTIRTIHIQAPSSKSMSHRAVIAASLAEGESTVSGVLDSDDLTRTMGCLTSCGAKFEKDGDTLRVIGVGGRPQGADAGAEPADLNVHESGTTCRLMTAVAAAGFGRFRIHGAPRMHERPIGALADTLTALGTSFEWENKAGYPPCIMTANGFSGGEVAVDVGESSQYLSGLLLGAPCAPRHTIIGIGGTKVVSWPYVALTLSTLEDFGVVVKTQRLHEGEWVPEAWRRIEAAEPGQVRFVVRPGVYRAGDYRVEGDWSNASYFLAAGAVGPNPVVISGLREDSLQGDKAMLDILTRMGARITWQDDAVTVAPPESGKLKGIEVDMNTCPDIVPTVAVAASFADSPTSISGAAHLRIKECDRLDATATELNRAGGNVEILDDGLRITPASFKTGETIDFTTYGDHRLAMSMSILALAGITPRFDNPDCVGKSFPGFYNEWNKVVS